MIKVLFLDTTIPTDESGFASTPDESFIHALTTPLGSVIGNENYGTNFKKRKHRALNNSTLIDLKRDLKDDCKFDPRLSFQKAELNTQEISNGKISFDIFLSTGVITGEFVA